MKHKLLIVAVVTTIVAFVTPLRATPFTVDGVTYDITVQDLKYGDAAAQAILTSTPWWGNETLALDAAAVVGDSLGIGTDWYDGGSGPYFTYNGFGYAAFSAVWNGGSVGSTDFTVGYLAAPFAIGTIESTGSVPDGGTTATMLGAGMLGLVALRRRFARA